MPPAFWIPLTAKSLISLGSVHTALDAPEDTARWCVGENKCFLGGTAAGNKETPSETSAWCVLIIHQRSALSFSCSGLLCPAVTCPNLHYNCVLFLCTAAVHLLQVQVADLFGLGIKFSEHPQCFWFDLWFSFLQNVSNSDISGLAWTFKDPYFKAQHYRHIFAMWSW